MANRLLSNGQWMEEEEEEEEREKETLEVGIGGNGCCEVIV